MVLKTQTSLIVAQVSYGNYIVRYTSQTIWSKPWKKKTKFTSTNWINKKS